MEVLRQLIKLWESGQQAVVICTEVDSVEEDTGCGILDITTEPGTNSSDAEGYVIKEVQSVEVDLCTSIFLHFRQVVTNYRIA